MKLRTDFFETIKKNKTDKTLARSRRKKKRTQVNNIRNERGDITVLHTTQIQRIITDHYEHL